MAVTKMLAKNIGDALKCLACNRYCLIHRGNTGYCGVRANNNGELDLLVRNKPCAIWVDPIEKKPFFHFLPGTKSFSIGTFGCNFSCSFCQNWSISQAPYEARASNLKGWRTYFQTLVDKCDEWDPERVVEAAISSGSRSISFTYNEPTIFTEYAIDVMKEAQKQKNKLPDGKKLRGVYVSNGYESKECWKAISKYIDAVNIDLKAYNRKFYWELCKVPDYEPIKESIKIARDLGIWVEITTLVVPGWNDNEKELRQEAQFLASVDPEMPWHVTAFHPDYKLRDRVPTPPETLLRAREIGKRAGLKHVYCGNISFVYADYETTYCQKCRRELIKRTGFSLVDNNIIDGKCRHCDAVVKGVWE